MKKRKPEPWYLPDWQKTILLKALTDHELVLRLRDQGGYPYRVMLDQVRESLETAPSAPKKEHAK